MTDQQHNDLLLELENYVQNQLDESHWLRKRVCFVEELPKTQAGKVLKKKLRDAVKRYELRDMQPGARLQVVF